LLCAQLAGNGIRPSAEEQEQERQSGEAHSDHLTQECEKKGPRAVVRWQQVRGADYKAAEDAFNDQDQREERPAGLEGREARVAVQDLHVTSSGIEGMPDKKIGRRAAE